jgi:hypothetical protein
MTFLRSLSPLSGGGRASSLDDHDALPASMAVSPSSPQPATWLKVSSLLPVPLYTLAFIASFYLLSYLLFPHYFRRPKQRAAILSFICSPTVTLLSLPFVQDFVRSGGDVGLLTRERERDAAFALRRQKLGEMICWYESSSSHQMLDERMQD